MSHDLPPLLHKIIHASRADVIRAIAAILLTLFIAACISHMERRDDALHVTQLDIQNTPVTLTRPTTDHPLPLAIIAHGFGGSRQMMDQIAVTLARSGVAVASLDLRGHGRNTVPMSPDVTRIEGTTQQLINTVLQVTNTLRTRADIAEGLVLVGHSMATDVVIRAAKDLENVSGIFAISMYSDAVTATFPRNLAMISGSREQRLRDVALKNLQMVQSDAIESTFIDTGDLVRTAIVAPNSGHVGVLYHARTLTSISNLAQQWLDLRSRNVTLDRSGLPAALLLASIVALGLLLARWLPARSAPNAQRINWRQATLLLIAPIAPCLAIVFIAPSALLGLSGFAPFAAVLAIWGLVQITLLTLQKHPFPRPDMLATITLLVWGLALFGLALDRYGAAFLPTGPRLGLMAVLTLACLPLLLADSWMAQITPLWQRLLNRAALLGTLTAAMSLAPLNMGLTFTALPVMLLFFIVYGSLARAIETRRGASSTWLAMSLCLAWALAASTPLFATAS